MCLPSCSKVRAGCTDEDVHIDGDAEKTEEESNDDVYGFSDSLAAHS